ncbi:MAG: hypothetical protein PHE02_00225 [Lachnospiraceae bacterium]|nr:hypothetical protein [Lachnospiraceae bacterium]
MNKKIPLNKALLVLIITVCVAIMLSIWPGNVFQTKITNQVVTNTYSETGVVLDENKVLQEFIPSQNRLHSITVMVDSLGSSTGLFKLRLYDAALNVMCETGKRFNESPGIASYTFHLDQDVVAGQPYYYEFIYNDTTFSVCYATDEDSESIGDSGRMYYALQELPESHVIAAYQYEEPLSAKRVIAYDGIIVLIGLLLCGALVVCTRRGSRICLKEMTVDQVCHLFGITYLAMGTIHALRLIIIEHLFSAYVIENTVLSIGTLLTALAVGYGITRISVTDLWNRITFMNKESWHSWLTGKLPQYLQVVFWGMAILACVDFVNAGSNYAQGLAIRQMCIFFALAGITMFTGRELCNLWNLIYVIAAGLMVFFYSRSFVGQGEPFQTAVRTALMWATAGLIFISTSYNLAHRKAARFNLPLAALTVVFFVLLLVFRNNNIWEVAIVVPFTLFYIRPKNSQQTEQILGNIANGILFSFVITTLQALLYRPYHYYTMVRYSGVFMTVTVTAVYLGMVFAVALCRYLAKFEKSTKFSNVWKELLLMGLACGYEFLSLSRTGMVSCVVVYIATCVVYILCNKKYYKEQKKKLHPVRFLLYALIAVVCCIPITYTASRTIPALVNRPTIYVGEEFQDSIRVGEPVDSFRYITIEKVLGVSNERMLGKTDLNFVTQSGKTVEEVLEEAKDNNTSGDSTMSQSGQDTLTENGVSVDGDKLTYVDDYGDEYTIDNPDYSNGRMDTYKAYLKHLNLTGHPVIGLETEDGHSFVHAHNSFLQMAYDCGIVTGVVFFLLYVILGFRSIWYYSRRKENDRYALLPLAIFATFGISSMVEYVFRPTIPLGFVFLLMIMPLITKVDLEK